MISSLDHYVCSSFPKQPNAGARAIASANMLQEVLAAARPRGWHMPLIIADGTEQLEVGLQVVANFTDGRQVTASVTVVRRTPNGDDVLVGEVILITLVHELMGPCNQGKVVDMTELVGHAIAKQPS